MNEFDYLKKCYEDKSEQLYSLEKQFQLVKREKELAENYIDKLIYVIKQIDNTIQLPIYK